MPQLPQRRLPTAPTFRAGARSSLTDSLFLPAGTLLDTAEPVVDTYVAIAAQHGVTVTPQTVKANFRQPRGWLQRQPETALAHKPAALHSRLLAVLHACAACRRAAEGCFA